MTTEQVYLHFEEAANEVDRVINDTNVKLSRLYSQAEDTQETAEKLVDLRERYQLVFQGRSFSGFRTTQMCLMRSLATSNAITVTVTPSICATRPG